ncbi:MAG: choice-of-anchor Q domain-containing protein, partial [Lysobacterales bacterium]
MQTANGNGETNTINLAVDGEYVLNSVEFGSNPSGLPRVESDLVINGNGAVIRRSLEEGTPSFRILLIDTGASATLHDLTIRDGFTTGFGGGISSLGVLTLEQCQVLNNTSAQGGGIFNTGLLTLTRTVISENVVVSGNGGGAIYSQGVDAELILSNSTVSDNISGTAAGGGIRSLVSASGLGGIATLTDTMVTGNSAPGVNGWGGGIDNNGTMVINGGEISGNSANLDGGGIHTARSLSVDGTVMANNTAGRRGGGVANNIGMVVIIQTEIAGNTAVEDGGGIYHTGTNAENSVMTIQSSLIRENVAQNNGGGLWSYRPVQLSDTRIVGNAAADGAGVHHSNNDFTGTNCTIAENLASGNGGGMHITARPVMLDSCTISGNQAVMDGGGLHLASSFADLFGVNLTVSGNTAGATGGGLRNLQGVFHLVNTTVAANLATVGGGLSNAQAATNRILDNTLVAGSTGGDIEGLYTDAGHNLVQDGTGVIHVTSLTEDPLLQSLADNGGPTMTHALEPGSPAIGAGNCANDSILVDQRGVERPQPPGCDIGSFESVEFASDLLFSDGFEAFTE